MRLREPALISLAIILAMATPVATMSPAAAASAKAPTIVDVAPSTATARTGSTFKLKVIAENESKQASASHKLQFLLSKTTSPTGARKIGEGTITSFAAKTRKTFGFSLAIPSNAAAGSFRLLLCHPRSGEPLLCHKDNVKLTVTLAPAKLTISPTSYDYGDVVRNDGGGKRFTVRNVGRRWSGAVAVSLSGAQASSFGFIGYSCGPSLAPQATCTIDAVFSPTSVGTFHATLKVKPSANYSTGATAALSGTGVTPASLASSGTRQFGDVATGSSSPYQTVTVTNVGGSPSGTITTSLVHASADQFSTSDDQCNGQILAAGAQCTVKVRFDPTSNGIKGAGFRASASPGGITETSLVGTGAPPAAFSLSPISLNFGDQVIGTSSVKTLTLTNTGGLPSGDDLELYVNGAGYSLDGPTTTCLPASSLAAGASCTIGVRFEPAEVLSFDGLVGATAHPPEFSVLAGVSGNGINPPV